MFTTLDSFEPLYVRDARLFIDTPPTLKCVLLEALIMSRKFSLAVCQMLGSMDKSANIQKAVTMISEAASKGARMVVLPECFNSPYNTKLFDSYAEPIPRTVEAMQSINSATDSPTFHAMRQASLDNKVWLVAGSIPERCPETQRLFNTCMVFDHTGVLHGIYRKMHLFRINTEQLKVDEGETLTAGDSALVVDVNIDDISFKMGIGICFDGRYPQLALHYAHLGTSLLVYPSAFNMVTGPKHWELMGRSRAVDAQQYFVLASPARDTEASYVAYGHSMIVDSWGEKVAETDEKESIVFGEVDIDSVANSRSRLPILAGERKDLYTLSF